MIAGVWVIFYLPDRPKDAKWLTTEERTDWLTTTLESEKQALAAKAKGSMWKLILRPEVFLLTAVWFLSTSVTNAFGLWLPKIVQGMSGFGTIVTVLVAAVPYLLALPFSLVIGRTSDRTGERRWHAAGCMFLSAAGFALVAGHRQSCDWVVGPDAGGHGGATPGKRRSGRLPVR